MIFGILSVVKEQGVQRHCNGVFVDVVRGVPMIVLAMFVFFGVPYCLNNMMGMGVTPDGASGGHHLPGAELRRLYGRDHPSRHPVGR